MTLEKAISSPFSKYNTSYYVSYSSKPTFLTSNYIKDPNTNDVSLDVDARRNITNYTGSKVIGDAFYNIDLQADKNLTFLQGPYTALQQFTDKKSNNKYVVFKSGTIDKPLTEPLNETNYDQNIVDRVFLKYEIVQSVVIEDIKAKKIFTFTNVGVTNKTNRTTLKTQYFLNFNNAILTISQPLV